MNQPDLFGMPASTGLALARAVRDAKMSQAQRTAEQQAPELLARVTSNLIRDLKYDGRRQFTSDDIGTLLDELDVSKDLATRRRIVSTVINKGVKAKLWHKVGYQPSRRRHCAPIVLWEITT